MDDWGSEVSMFFFFFIGKKTREYFKMGQKMNFLRSLTGILWFVTWFKRHRVESFLTPCWLHVGTTEVGLEFHRVMSSIGSTGWVGDGWYPKRVGSGVWRRLQLRDGLFFLGRVEKNPLIDLLGTRRRQREHEFVFGTLFSDQTLYTDQGAIKGIMYPSASRAPDIVLLVIFFLPH